MVRSSIGCALALALFLGLAPAAGAAPADLARSHRSEAATKCRDCHVEGDPKKVVPEVALASVNRQCISCHGDLAKVAKEVAAKKAGHAGIDPHQSHLVDPDCTVCHFGHDRPGRAYCLECHEFAMPMPGAGAAAGKPEGAQ